MQTIPFYPIKMWIIKRKINLIMLMQVTPLRYILSKVFYVIILSSLNTLRLNKYTTFFLNMTYSFYHITWSAWSW